MKSNLKIRLHLITISYIQAAHCLDVMAIDIISNDEKRKAKLHYQLKRVEDLRNWYRRTLAKHRITENNHKLKQKYNIKEG